MKIKDLKLNSDDDACEHCIAYSTAEKQLPRYECAHCNAPLAKDGGEWGIVPDHDGIAVGETNRSNNAEENIFRADIFRCAACGEYTAYLPTKVIYNGNHDTFYTGGAHYVVDEDVREALQAHHVRVRAHAEQWLNRLREGDPSLSAWNIAQWVMYDAEQTFAELLFKKGLKR